jgi:hypothetical protein
MKKVVSSLLKNNIRRIIKSYFEGEYIGRTTGMEFEMECPFCNGGPRKELSFNINVDKAAVRCWRATCDYKGSFYKFVKDYFEVEQPSKFIYGEVDELSVIVADLAAIEEQEGVTIEIQTGDVDVWLEGLESLSESPSANLIEDWISTDRDRGGRGYSFKKFKKQHSIYVPRQYGFMKGRVCFEVTTKGSRAYLLYAFQSGVFPKTINPENATLSRMLYNYNSIKKGSFLLVHEGIFDCARTKSYGYSSVAIFGVHMSFQQAFLIYELEPSEICLCFDGGTTKDMMNVFNKYKELWANITVSLVDLKDIKNDPDNMSEEELLGFISERYILNEPSNSEESILDGIANLQAY